MVRAQDKDKDKDKDDGLVDKLVHINRVAKVVKGGRRFAFAALVVVGDKKGRIGLGSGKAREVPEAIRKATDQAKRTLLRIPLREGRTLHHDIVGKFGAGKVILRSASAGTGIIAGGPMRAVFEVMGVQDVVSKSQGSNNPYNMVKATFKALQSLNSPRMIAAQINENNKMEGAKSFTMQIQLATSNPHLTPVVDLDRCSLITTSSRINYWPGGSAAIPTQAAIDRNADTSTDPVGDQNDAIYCTRLARLANESRSLRLAFQITRNADAFIYPYYKVFTFGASTRPEDVDWTPFPENINYDSTPSEELLWKDFEYEVKGLNFNAFQIKLVMKSKNQASVPLIADLRATALAT